MLRPISGAIHDQTIRAMNKTLEAIRARRARQAGVVIEEKKPKRGKAKVQEPAEELPEAESPAVQGPSHYDFDDEV
jgi:hypothetical protein